MTAGSVVLRWDRNLDEREVVTYDARGHEKTWQRIDLSAGLVELEVPPSGLLSISGPDSR
jgi:hypothetical protein